MRRARGGAISSLQCTYLSGLVSNRTGVLSSGCSIGGSDSRRGPAPLSRIILPCIAIHERSIVHHMAEPILEDLGRKVRALRHRAGLSVRELSARSSLSTRFLIDVESGEGNISARRRGIRAQALGRSASALLASEARGGVIALLGIRGAGKTTIGRRLARRLRIPFVELDRTIEDSSGLSLEEIFALHGEAYYR